ncbi:SulP family inorganic anion transporter [Kitasatospora cineracea]|uniref:MFS superfamily sulfate permease-like transporter n=1 Tax=Kitasatospora cineracea TaxID=88074 RepID=A0A8G1UJT6_9ACTN|nr:MFS superfamily sulfate permease-like transporter [Kitasatospora cineracea]
MNTTETNPTGPAAVLRGALAHWRQDLPASLVVFLVAVPLCVGVAVASGVPAERGLVTGIVGGLVVGLLPGSSLQVSGPAAGLTVLVFDAVQRFGLGSLGVLVLAAGLLQIAMGLARMGRWFRAISLSVVHGMLAGIGLILILGQLYAVSGRTAPGSGGGKITHLPGLAADWFTGRAATTALLMGAATVALLTFWKKLPGPVRAVPAPLAAVALAAAATAVFGLDVPRVRVDGLAGALALPTGEGIAAVATTAGLGTVLAFALIASAESLFSAAAVDQMHHGPRTDYDRELAAQGIGNTLCGLLGALPLTAVIVRSAANVQAGARTKASRILHGLWLLLFAALLPAVLGLIPLAVLGGVLIHAGAKLIPVRPLGALWRGHRGELAVMAATTTAIVFTNLFEGVLLGVVLAVAKSAWQTSQLHIDLADGGPGGPLEVRLSGNATFLRLPRLLDTLESLPAGRAVHLDWSGLRHLDHACRTALLTWAARHGAHGTTGIRWEPPLAATAAA